MGLWRLWESTLKTIKLLQLSDLHLKADPNATMKGGNVWDSFCSVVEEAKTSPDWPPDLVALTGDIAHDETLEGYRQVYQWLVEELGPFADLCFIPGNHDDAALLHQTFEGTPIKTKRCIELENWRLVLLDSTIPGEAGGKLNKEQLSTLDNALNADDGKHCLVLIHHPLIDINSQWMDTMKVRNGQAFFDLVAGNEQLKAVASGHAHQAFDILHQGVRLLGAPATCPVQFKPGSKEYAEDRLPPGARWLTLHPDGRIEAQVIRASG